VKIVNVVYVVVVFKTLVSLFWILKKIEREIMFKTNAK
jgi:hypothetical protein